MRVFQDVFGTFREEGSWSWMILAPMEGHGIFGRGGEWWSTDVLSRESILPFKENILKKKYRFLFGAG
jgi:hypothetical protein